MKQYLITKKELHKFLEDSIYIVYTKSMINYRIEKYLKSQKHIEVFATGELHMMGEAYVNSKDKKEENVEAWVNRMIAKKPVKYRGKGMIIKLEVSS